MNKASQRLNGKAYFFDRARNMLKNKGLMLVKIEDDVCILPIKSYNLVIKDYDKKIAHKADPIETRKNAYAFLKSLHKDEYWNVLPHSYKGIILSAASSTEALVSNGWTDTSKE